MEETQEVGFKEILKDLNTRGTKVLDVLNPDNISVAFAIKLHTGNFAVNDEMNLDTFWIFKPHEIREYSPKNIEIVDILNNINAQISDLEKLKISVFEKME